MKFTIVAVSAAFVGVSVAQGIQGLPTCAQSCAENAIPQSCGVDVKCICSATSFIQSVTCCVNTACDASDQQKTLQYAQQLCAGAGVTITSADATCNNSSSTAGSATSGTATATGSAASGASSTSSTAGTTKSSGSSASSASSVSSSHTSSASVASSTGNAAPRDIVAQGLSVAGLAVAGAFALV